MTLKKAMEKYLTRINRENTRASYQDTFRLFGEISLLDPLSVKASQISGILEKLPVSKHTKHLRLCHMKALFNAIHRGMRSDGFTGPLINPCSLISSEFRKPKINGKPVPEDYDATVSRFIERLNAKYRLIALLGSGAGLRIGEILHIRPVDLLNHAKYTFIQINDPKSGANLELRSCPPDIMAELRKYIEMKGIAADARIFPITRQAVNMEFKKYGFEPHDMRRYAAYKAQSLGIPIKGIQGMLGHSSPLTTVRYLNNLSPVALAKTLEPMNGG